MTIKNKLLASALLSLSMASFANDLGALGSTLVVQTLRIDAQDVSFSSRTYFSLDLDALFYAAAQSSNLSLAEGLVLGLFVLLPLWRVARQHADKAGRQAATV